MFLIRMFIFLKIKSFLLADFLFCYRFLASVNLPAAIEDSGGRQIPPSVNEKSNEIKRQGGINMLDKMINELPEALQRNKEILDEVKISNSSIKILFSFLFLDNSYVR